MLQLVQFFPTTTDPNSSEWIYYSQNFTPTTNSPYFIVGNYHFIDGSYSDAQLILVDNIKITELSGPLLISGPENICPNQEFNLSIPICGDLNENTITWTTNGQVIGEGTSSITVSQDHTTTYNVSVINSITGYNESSQLTVLTEFPSQPVIEASPSFIYCNTENSQGITIGISNPVDGAIYNWNPGNYNGITFNINPSENTTYTVIGTLGCQTSEPISAEIVVDRPLPLTFSPSSGTICGNEEIEVQVSGGFGDYNWSPNLGITCLDIGQHCSTVNITQSNISTYVVLSGSAPYCTHIGTFSLNHYLAPIITIGEGNQSCNFNSVLLTSSSNTGNQWYFNGQIIVGATGPTFLAQSSGEYSVKVEFDDCELISNPIHIDIWGPPQVSFSGLNSQYCLNSPSVNLTGSPAGVDFSGLGISGDVFSPTDAGIGDHAITYTYTDENECVGSATITTHVYGLPNANAGSDASICLGSSTQLNATGGATYSWSPATGLSATDIANPVANPTHTTDYTVTVTDGNGCSQTDIVTVTVNNLPTVTISPSGSTTFCQGGSVTLNASSGTSYSWNTGATTQSITVSTAGNYSVTVTDGNGCSGSNSVTISTISNPTVYIETITPSSCSSNNCTGSATIDITNSSNYAINWNTTPDQTGLTATGLCPGNYLVTVTDNTTDCETQQPIVVDFSGNCCYNPDFDGVLNNVSYSGGLGTLGILPGVQVVPGAVSGSAPRVLNNKFTINGTFTIQSDLNFQGCEILMGPDAQIVVLNGADVNFDQCYIHECRLFWNYISMGNNSKIYFNNSIVQGARIGVFALGSNLSTTLLSVENSIFNRNGIHLFTLSTLSLHVTGSKFGCNNLSGLGTSWPQSIQSLSFGSNTFLPSAFLNSTTSMVGILATQNNSITIGDMNENSNLFQNCGLGIANLSSSVKIYNSIFKGMFNQTTNPINTNGIGIWARANSNKQNYSFLAEENSFENCQFAGMKVENYKQSVTIENNEVNLGNGQYSNSGINLVNNKGATISVKENQVQNCQAGIFGAMNYPTSTNLSSNLIAYRNSTTLNTYGLIWMEALPSGNSAVISDNYIYNVNNGITLNGVVTSSGFLFGSQIAGNYINPPTGSAPPVGNQPTISGNNILNKGIQLYNMHGAGVYNNFVKGSGIGINTNNNAGFYSSIGHNFFVCNTSQDVYSGFTFSGASNPNWMIKNEMNTNAIGLYLSNGGVIGNVGSLDTPNDNIWVNNTYGHGVDGNTNANSQFIYHRNGGNSAYIPTVLSSLFCMNVSIPSNGDENNYDCPSENGSLVTPPNEGISIYQAISILNDTIKRSINNEETRWMNLENLYRTLENNDSIIATDSILKDFIDSCQTSNLGKIYRSMLAWNEISKNYNLTISYIDTLSSLSPANEMEANYKEVLGILFEEYLDSSLTLDSASWEFQRFIKDSLTIDFQNDSVLLFLMDRGHTINQLNGLTEIALKCPYSDGPAVHMARAILASINHDFLTYSDSCATDSNFLRLENPSNSSIQSNQEEWVKFYPNPAKEAIKFKCNLQLGSSAIITITDILGRTIQTFMLADECKEIEKDVSIYTNGTYFLIVKINDKYYKNEPLIILR